MGRYLLTLQTKQAQNPYLAGGKGAGLARLDSNGFQVPPTYIIPTSAFRRLQSQLIQELSLSPADITPEHLESLRAQILNHPLPSSVEDAVSKAWANLGTRVAVRSSMAGEDSCTLSYAGLLDTFLNIEEEQAVLTAVKKCLASTFNWRLWKYQQRHKQSLRRIREALGMAVIIQDMVVAQAAGVAFSSDPNTGARDVIIEAVPGLGKKLVQGHCTPHRFIIDDNNTMQHFPAGPGSDSPLELQAVHLLAETVRKVASTCGSHQDIEWAWDGNDFYFLQCRPITALPDQRIYSARLVADMSPGLIKPLLWSTKSRSMVRSVFGRIGRELLGPHQIDFATYIKRFHSRTYADMTAFGDFLERLGLPPNFFEAITRHEKSKWHAKMLHPKRLPLLLRLTRFAWRHFRSDKEITAFLRAQSSRLEQFRQTDWISHPSGTLLDKFEQLLELHATTQWYIFIGPLNMTLRYRLLSRILKGVEGADNPGDLLGGIEGFQALEPNLRIKRMSRLAKELDKQVIGLMLEGDHRKLKESLLETEKGRAIWQHFQDFQSHFGFLSANGSDFSAIPWEEDPSPVWRSMGHLALHETQWDIDRVHEAREKEVRAVRLRLKGMRRILFDRLMSSTAHYMKLREGTSLVMSEETYLMRCALMNIALNLQEEARLAEPSDIFFLYHDELRDFLTKELPDEEVKRRIESRKTEMDRDASFNPPEIISGESPTPALNTDTKEEDFLEGIRGSPGRIQGKARIVLDPMTVSGELYPDDILVVPFTDVGWTPLLPGIGGIIAETGGQLSHTSIIAREYGLPAVVSVREATRRIKNGQPVTIDGDKGRVYLRHI